MMTALRLFLPTAGITLSTRESAKFRMAVLPLGVTRMSAGVSTSVGGHGGSGSTAQFEIADTRDVPTVKADLLAAGYQPVMHDWSRALTG
jgi:2-iminoacetate synthase